MQRSGRSERKRILVHTERTEKNTEKGLTVMQFKRTLAQHSTAQHSTAQHSKADCALLAYSKTAYSIRDG